MTHELMKPPAPKPCDDCPWRRNAVAGWLGPYDFDEWLILAHCDEPIACHQTIVEDESFEGTRACAGAAIYRANVAKIPRLAPLSHQMAPDREAVFAMPTEFVRHHTREG